MGYGLSSCGSFVKQTALPVGLVCLSACTALIDFKADTLFDVDSFFFLMELGFLLEK